MQKPRTLIIGLDGATFDLLEPWTRAGYLPSIAKLIDHGIHGPLCVWPNMNSAAAWSSLITGYNSGQHGIFDFGERPPQRGVN
jgi:predicted AlkP superfamily phosphohydrolase/phosphomutase